MCEAKKLKRNKQQPPPKMGAKASKGIKKTKSTQPPPPPTEDEKEAALKQRFLKAYKRTDRHIANSCKAAGVSRTKVYKVWMKDKQFLADMAEVEDQFMDLAKSKVWGIIKNIDIKKPGREATQILLEIIKKDKTVNPAEKGKLEELADLLNPHGYK